MPIGFFISHIAGMGGVSLKGTEGVSIAPSRLGPSLLPLKKPFKCLVRTLVASG